MITSDFDSTNCLVSSSIHMVRL